MGYLNNGFLLSDKVKVFPSAYRTQGQNVESKLNTEFNYTLPSRVLVKDKTKDSYIISKTTVGSDITYEVILHGYWFKLTFASGDAIPRYACINTLSVGIGDPSSSEKTEVLIPKPTTTPAVGDLDVKGTDDKYYFKGIWFANSASDATYYIDLSSASSYMPISSEAVESKIPGKAITGYLINGTKENSVKLGNNTTADKDNLVAIGEYNTVTNGDLFVVGNGISTAAPSNVLEVNKDFVKINKPLNNTNISQDSLTNTLTIKGVFSGTPTLNINNSTIATIGTDGTAGTLTINTNTIKFNGALDLPANAVYPHSVLCQTNERTSDWKTYSDDSASLTNSTFVTRTSSGGINAKTLTLGNSSKDGSLIVKGKIGSTSAEVFKVSPITNGTTTNIGLNSISSEIDTSNKYTNTVNFGNSNTINNTVILAGKTNNVLKIGDYSSDSSAIAKYPGQLELYNGSNSTPVFVVTKDGYVTSVKSTTTTINCQDINMYNNWGENTLTLGSSLSKCCGAINLYGSNTTSTVFTVDSSGNTKAATFTASRTATGNTFANNGDNPNFCVTSDGDVTAQTYNAKSDKRLKENIVDYTLEKSILDLQVKKFDFIDGKKNNIGCIAQELQEICPEIVHENEDGYLSIEENKLVYLLLDEVKKLRKEVNELKK